MFNATFNTKSLATLVCLREDNIKIYVTEIRFLNYNYCVV